MMESLKSIPAMKKGRQRIGRGASPNEFGAPARLAANADSRPRCGRTA
jgi:hypothetical protein